MSIIFNVPINEIKMKLKATYSKTCTSEDILPFAKISGDINPVHLDDNYAKNTIFNQRIAHGMYTGALISAALAVELPGPGTIYLGQDIKFMSPVFIGDNIIVELIVESFRLDKGIVTLSCICYNQDGLKVAKGTATVIAPKEKIAIKAFNIEKI